MVVEADCRVTQGGRGESGAAGAGVDWLILIKGVEVEKVGGRRLDGIDGSS